MDSNGKIDNMEKHVGNRGKTAGNIRKELKTPQQV